MMAMANPATALAAPQHIVQLLSFGQAQHIALRGKALCQGQGLAGRISGGDLRGINGDFMGFKGNK